MTRPKLFAELCAGTAALSLALQGGARCRPPVSRPGAKTGYSEAILGAAGLYRGQGAESYLFCEPEPGPRSVLACYPDPAKLREVEAVIRGWIGEDPRALWGRLREAMKGRELTCPEWIIKQAWGATGQYCGPDRGGVCGSHPEGWTGSITIGGLQERLSALASLHWPPVAIAEDARGVRVEDVAGWLWMQPRTHPGGGGFLAADHVMATGSRAGDTFHRWLPDSPARELSVLASVTSWPPVAIAPDARQVSPGGADLEGCVAYIDPPYVGTTPYANDLPRADVLALARAWSDAGALVMISEAVPVEGLGSGWESLEITGHRRGQARTWAREKHEFLTMNRPPVHRMAEQPGLFAAAK